MYSLRAISTRRFPLATRSFASTARLQSGGSHVSDNDPEVLEREKQKNLKGTQHKSAPHHKDHAPGWNEKLASVSEAFVKADQAPIKNPEELTKVTIEYVKQHHEEDGEDFMQFATDAVQASNKVTGQDVRDEAYYEKEVIEGPLGGNKVERDEVKGPLAGAGSKQH